MDDASLALLWQTPGGIAMLGVAWLNVLTGLAIFANMIQRNRRDRARPDVRFALGLFLILLVFFLPMVLAIWLGPALIRTIEILEGRYP
jgi:hypothetical protein